MHPNDAPIISDSIMQALLSMLKSTSGRTSVVQEDALIAIGTLVEGKEKFVMDSLRKYLFF